MKKVAAILLLAMFAAPALLRPDSGQRRLRYAPDSNIESILGSYAAPSHAKSKSWSPRPCGGESMTGNSSRSSRKKRPLSSSTVVVPARRAA
jgi:hypothetical protein